ncbi:hypothetical protein DENSPDRAFT_867314 [Dentipellis sp. KUC8613]|nr:hypothetical protein DENSPDRAFT_867314 [Dentipellis sp. KUC8613]
MNHPKDPHLQSPTSRSSWASPSRFKEHLSLTVVPLDPEQAIEKSRFSPDSPEHAFPENVTPHSHSASTFSIGSSTMYRSSPRSKARDLESQRGPSTNSTPRTAGFRDRFTRMFFDVRSLRREPELGIPIQQPHIPMQQWPPLHIEKRNQECPCRQQHEHPLQKWRRRFLTIVLLLFLLYVLINLIVLDARVLSQPQFSSHGQSDVKTVTSTSPQSVPTSSAVSADTQQCITEYTLNAPSSPTTYPCSTCLPLVAAVPSNISSVYPTAVDAAQFCALRSLWEDADTAGQSGFESAGWVKDVKFCAWGGVQCDGTGRVSSLQMTFPAVPASIPNEFGNLTNLESFQVVGNNAIPGGPLPSSFSSLTKLSSLHIEATGLSGLPSTFPALTSLTLVRNAQIGNQLPSNIAQSPLQSLIVNNETLSLTSDQQSAFCTAGKLQTCDLRGTGVQSCGSCLVG